MTGRASWQRAAVQAVFDTLDGFHSAQDLHARLRAAGDPIGLSTVYRAVQTLTEDGALDALRMTGGEALYRRCSTRHHHHLVCRGCGRTVEVGGRPSNAGPTRSPPSTASPTSATPWRSSAPAPTAPAARLRGAADGRRRVNPAGQPERSQARRLLTRLRQ